MGNLSSIGLDLALAKRVAADIKAGLVEKEALLPFKELVLDRDFGAFLDRLDSHLVRFLNLAQRSGMDLNPIQNYAPKGKDIHLYSPPLPGEAQLRLAYEVALEAFLDYLETRGFAVLERRLGVYRVYAPKGFDLEKEWKGFLESYLGLEGLFSSLGLLLESGRLAPRGFSAPKVPLATEGMRLFLGSWYLASLGNLEKEIEELREELSKKQLNSEEERKKLVEELEKKLEKFRKTANRFGRIARKQLNTNRPDIRRKLVGALPHILEEPLVQIPPPLFEKPPMLKARPPGDRAKVCYGCGQPIKKGYGVSKLIFASPSQRLQSGYQQEEPKVCGTCAVLGLASPLKFGEGAVIVRVRAPLASLEEAKAFTRMVVLGSLNVAAGPYIQLNSPSVRTGGEQRPLAQVVGRVIYALAYVGREMNPRVLQKLDLEVLEGGQSIPLPRAALWLSHLYQVGFGARMDEGGEANRSLAEALRYALAGLPWHGEYVLARRYGRVVDPVRLEAGRRDYAELLTGGESMVKLTERFKDVAGLTGLLYAWADYIRAKGQNPKREIAKFLENLKSPYFASYVASYTLDATQATLYRNPRHHFLYEEALRLLREAGVEPNEKEGGLAVSQDDLAKAYTHLARKYEEEWKEFIYEVRLALASRFPEYIRAEKEG